MSLHLVHICYPKLSLYTNKSIETTEGALSFRTRAHGSFSKNPIINMFDLILFQPRFLDMFPNLCLERIKTQQNNVLRVFQHK